jgi:hypothetical protein
MRKSLLVWGALIVIALCFVGCCYYNYAKCSPCKKHCMHTPCCSEAGKKCQTAPAAADDTVETMTVEAVEIVPVQQGNTPAASPAPAAKNAPAAAAAPAGSSQTTGK